MKAESNPSFSHVCKGYIEMSNTKIRNGHSLCFPSSQRYVICILTNE
jgi:hypothetical protein